MTRFVFTVLTTFNIMLLNGCINNRNHDLESDYQNAINLYYLEPCAQNSDDFDLIYFLENDLTKDVMFSGDLSALKQYVSSMPGDVVIKEKFEVLSEKKNNVGYIVYPSDKTLANVHVFFEESSNCNFSETKVGHFSSSHFLYVWLRSGEGNKWRWLRE